VIRVWICERTGEFIIERPGKWYSWFSKNLETHEKRHSWIYETRVGGAEMSTRWPMGNHYIDLGEL